MKRRLLVAATATVILGAVGVSSGVGTITSAKAADLLHNRFTNRISGYILQDLAAGTPLSKSQPSTRTTQITSGANSPTVGTFGCSQTGGTNVRVNQDCTNQTFPQYAGRGQAQNETAIAVNPNNAGNLVAGQNDYRRGDGSCGADWSLDGGAHWGNVLLPIGFSTGGVDNPDAARHYFTSSGDPSVAFDSQGAAYYACGAFDRSFPTNDDAACANPAGNCASGLFVFRSVDGGASWDAPLGSRTQGMVFASAGVKSDTQFALEDKQYMTADSHPSSPFRDRLYIAWTHYAPCAASDTCESAPVWFSYSNDHGATWSAAGAISGSSASLCPHNLNPDTPNACDNTSFAQPVVAANGDVYVVFANYNNGLTSGGDNHNNILVVKSTDGGAHFSAPRLAARYYDLPDCVTYTGDSAFRACVPTAPLSNVSVFRAANYPSAAADPTDPSKIYVSYGSYINPDSNASNPAGAGRCVPQGLDSTTFLNLYQGVGDVNGCNNDILLSTSSDGGKSWSGAVGPLSGATVVSNEGSRLADQWWQWAAVNSSGTLAVSYYDRKYGSDESNGNNDVTLAAWHTSAFAHKRVTSVSNPSATEFPDATNGHGTFLGDYSGLAVSEGLAYPIWSDTRNAERFQCPSSASPLGLCRVTNGSVPGFDEDVFSTTGLTLP